MQLFLLNVNEFESAFAFQLFVKIYVVIVELISLNPESTGMVQLG